MTTPVQQPVDAETRMAQSAGRDPLLLQIRSDRRLGHEWDDWDGGALPNDGVFHGSERLFFKLLGGLLSVWVVGLVLILWVAAPRLALVGISGTHLAIGVAALLSVCLAWAAAVAIALRTGRVGLPRRLAERGLIPWLMPRLETFGPRVGVSRDRSGNAVLRVYNKLMILRSRNGLSPEELLILLPRCLSKDAMHTAMNVSERYGVPLFVAARGRYARQMIAMRRPKAVVAVACERDLVSGVHDVAGKLPVLGTTLGLPDGPCRNTEFASADLERQVRSMLGLGETDMILDGGARTAAVSED